MIILGEKICVQGQVIQRGKGFDHALCLLRLLIQKFLYELNIALLICGLFLWPSTTKGHIAKGATFGNDANFENLAWCNWKRKLWFILLVFFSRFNIQRCIECIKTNIKAAVAGNRCCDTILGPLNTLRAPKARAKKRIFWWWNTLESFLKCTYKGRRTPNNEHSVKRTGSRMVVFCTFSL